MRTLSRILALGVALGCVCSAAVAQEDGPNMLVTAGFNGYCHERAWCPVHVVLSNEAADIEGELHLSVPAAGSGPDRPDVYSRRVVLPSHSRKAFSLYIPSPVSAYGGLLSHSSSVGSSQLKVQLVAGRRLLASQEVSLRYVGEDDRLYGVISSSPSSLNFLTDISPASGQAFVAHLGLEILPPDPLGWEGLDVLVLNDTDTAALSADQQQALRTWLALGGHLIVGGGAGTSQTAAGVADLLPVAVEGTDRVEALDALGEYLDVPVVSGPFLVAQTTLKAGETLIKQGNLIVLARRTVGAGTVDFLAFDAGLRPFTRWEHSVEMWKSIVGTWTADSRRLTVQNPYSAQQAIGAIPGLKPPSTLQLTGFLLAYTVLVGPVNYLVLRRLDRRELAWVTIPVLIVAFTACAYVMGLLIRGRTPTVHRLGAVYVPCEAEEGYATELVGLFSPRRTRYDVRVLDATFRGLPRGDWSDSGPGSLHVRQEAGTSTVTDLRVDVGALGTFLAEGYIEAQPPETSLRLTNEAGGTWARGTLVNRSRPLRDALILTDNDEQPLGDLQPGQTRSVSLAMGGPILPPREDLAGRIMGPSSYPEDPERRRRYQFLQAIFPYGEPNLRPGSIYLVGWLDEAPLEVDVLGKESSTVAATLYIYELPVAPLEPGTTILVHPAPIVPPAETTGYVTVDENYIFLSGSSSAVIHFAVWPEVRITQVDRLTLDLARREYTSGPLPRIALWNRRTERWEQIEAAWGANTVSTPGRYVGIDGTVRIRLETDADQLAEMQMIRIVIEGRS